MSQKPPDERPNLLPALRYTDAPGAVVWLARTFGFEPMMQVPNSDGTLAHAEMKLGSGVIMLGSKRAPEPTDYAEVNLDHGIYGYVADVDAHYQRARAAGAEILAEPHDTDYDSREYSAKDLDGNHWSFGTYRPEQ
ncbi:MAG TPA: VOC family protein [Isosphaeraceae bacterium]|jgi:uncharacterized glyoxalase superfamily protein PhnB|nr:VOC family protein [Isosphaeraceae bacterium]